MEVKPAGHSETLDEKRTVSGTNRYEVQNNRGTRLVLSDYGAAVVSIFVADNEGRMDDIVLGYDEPGDYMADDYYMGTVIGRFANRIAGDTVVIANRKYKLATRQGGYHQHGGMEGFNKKIFTAKPFHHGSSSGVVFSYTSPAMEEGYPGEFNLEVTYTLDDDDNWTVEYNGTSSETTLVNLTQHSYFNLTGDPSLTIDDHEFRIFSDRYLPVNPLQMPTGELADVDNTPFDFKRFRKIDQSYENEQLKLSQGYDHSFVLKTEHSDELKHAVAVREPSTGRRLDVYTTEPSVHFYAGNFLENVKGKQGMIYNKRSGFCLETQHYPDSPNHPHFPSTELKAGERFYSKTVFRFSVA